MESTTNNLETKYQKLATEYSKLRAQASVLKKAVIEEQNKNSQLRETLRQKETSLRRAEQEVDSIGFRNKQLEHRVASLQDDIEKETSKKANKNQKSNRNRGNSFNNTPNDVVNPVGGNENISADSLIVEELQKKILENAQLTSLIDDKDREITLHNDRIKDLEKQIEKRNIDVIELERRLRKEIDSLQARNSELETKLVEAASMMGSEDALSASGSDNTPLHTTNSSASSEEKIAFLEKELFHWRTQYEILKIGENAAHHHHHHLQQQQQQHQQQTCERNNKEMLHNGPSNSSSTTKNSNNDNNLSNDNHQNEQLPKEQVLYNHFSKKFEELLKAKCMAESRLNSYLTECENLQSNMEFLTKEIEDKDKELKNLSRIIQTLEEDLATTRINYEEQISVLTEQVISLSEQLASSK